MFALCNVQTDSSVHELHPPITVLMVSMAEVNSPSLAVSAFCPVHILPHFVSDATPLISCIIHCQYLPCCVRHADVDSLVAVCVVADGVCLDSLGACE